jgi:hypothetical protein
MVEICTGRISKGISLGLVNLIIDSQPSLGYLRHIGAPHLTFPDEVQQLNPME